MNYSHREKLMKRKRRMKFDIGHGMELRIVADQGVRAIDPVIELLERSLGFCRKFVDDENWQYDGGGGLGREVEERYIYEIFVGPCNCTWETSPPYPARIEAMVPVLALAKQAKDAGGDIEALRELLKAKAGN